MDIDAPSVSGTAAGTAAIYGYSSTAPAAPVSGQIWYDTTTTPPSAKFYDGSAWQLFNNPSISIIKPTTVTGTGVSFSNGAISFTSALSVGINGCFSAAYDNYMIVANIVAGASDSISMRLRVGGFDNSSALYAFQMLDAAAAVATASRVTGATSFSTLSIATVTVPSAIQMNIFNPFATAATVVNANTASSSGAAYGRQVWGNHTGATSFDGFTLFPVIGTTTLTGTMKIYGLRNA